MLKLLKRSFGRVKRIARLFRLDYIPLNKKFRPVGIIKLREGHQGVCVVDIRRGFTSTMALPVEFLADCSDYCKPPLHVQFDSAFVASVENGRVFAHDENKFCDNHRR